MNTHHKHDWRMDHATPGETGPRLILQCEDCNAWGVLDDATAAEFNRWMHRSADYRPVFEGLATRVVPIPPPPGAVGVVSAPIPDRKIPAANLRRLNEYLDSGRWYMACREWIRTYAPCTRDEFFDRLAPRLPTDIKSRAGGHRSQMSLAYEALRRLPLVVDGELIVALQRGKRKSPTGT